MFLLSEHTNARERRERALVHRQITTDTRPRFAAPSPLGRIKPGTLRRTRQHLVHTRLTTSLIPRLVQPSCRQTSSLPTAIPLNVCYPANEFLVQGSWSSGTRRSDFGPDCQIGPCAGAILGGDRLPLATTPDSHCSSLTRSPASPTGSRSWFSAAVVHSSSESTELAKDYHPHLPNKVFPRSHV